MLKQMSIRTRMMLIFFAAFFLFIEMAAVSYFNAQELKQVGIDKAASVMYEDQKAKIRTATDSMAMALSAAIKNADPEEQIHIIRQIVNPIRYEDDRSGYYFVFKDSHNIALPPKKELEGTDMGDLKDENGVYYVKALERQAKNGGGFVDYIFHKPNQGKKPKLGYAQMISDSDYWIGTGVYIDNIEKNKAMIAGHIEQISNNKTKAMALINGLIFLLLILPLHYFISRSIIKPIRKAAGNLNAGADQVAVAAGEIAGSGQSLAIGASNQASAVQQTTATVNQINSMVRMILEQARESKNAVDKTGVSLIELNKQMASLTGTLTQVSEAGENTRKIIKTIEEIAFQTNLLSLNAAVEAAHAGDFGAGFSVVAGEIRNLALRSAEAAKSTAELIGESNGQISASRKVMSNNNTVFRQLKTDAKQIDDLSGEIVDAGTTLLQGIREVDNAMTHINEIIQLNAAGAEETASSSEELSAQAHEMLAIAERLTSTVEGEKNKSAVNGNGKGKIRIKNLIKHRTRPLPEADRPPLLPEKNNLLIRQHHPAIE